jgi:glycosyltransferase involved in cell wall biosynthesis
LKHLVSIIMPVYNCERYLDIALNSILKQSYSNFELIIIDDGSTDGTHHILSKVIDRRVLIISEGHNGLVPSLNRGLHCAKGKYIAIMHGDDIASADRIQVQVQTFAKYPEIGILGSACQLIDETGRTLGARTWPITDIELRWESLLQCPFAHPSVMMRRDVLRKNDLTYDDSFVPVEDYELWTRILQHTSGMNLRKPLLRYRIHSGSISSRSHNAQMKLHDRVAYRAIRRDLPECHVNQEDAGLLRCLFVGGRNTVPGLHSECIHLSDVYLNMFDSFSTTHAGKPGIEVLHFKVAAKVASRILRPPIQNGWLQILRRLLKKSGGGLLE